MKKSIILGSVLAFGLFNAQTRKVGININTPSETLDVDGTMRVRDLPQYKKKEAETGKTYGGLNNTEKNEKFIGTKAVIANNDGVLGYVPIYSGGTGMNTIGDDSVISRDGLHKHSGEDGWRLIGADTGARRVTMGTKAVDLSVATKSGVDNGNPSGAAGGYSFAVGLRARSEGFSSIAMGEGTYAKAASSMAVGARTIASNEYETAVGYQNISHSNQIFSVGNGAGTKATEQNRPAQSNAFVIMKDAKTGIGLVGDTPKEMLDVRGAIKVENGGYTGITHDGTSPVPVGGAGTIVFSGNDFFGWTGTQWKKLNN